MPNSPKCVSYFLLAVLILAAPSQLLAHPLSPSLWKLTETAPGQVAMSWKTPAATISGEELIPEIPRGCSIAQSTEARREKAFWVTQLKLTCDSSWRQAPLTVRGISESRSNVILVVRLEDRREFQHVLHPGSALYAVPERPSRTGVLKDYFSLGLSHILSGWDHLLFVMGLFLLITSRRSLVLAITAFTAGHSITLSIAVLELVTLRSDIVELCIAVSILVLALELLRDQRTFFHRHSWSMAFGFGLLHGLGFAGALSEIGLPNGAIPLALFSFNLGIEAGQLLFITFLVALTAATYKVAKPNRLVRLALPSYVIGSLAAFWFFERLTMFTS